jgi:uncharacterized protein (DUF433 family)
MAVRRLPCPALRQAADRREARAIDTVPASYHISAMIDWTNCPDVERTPGTLSGAWRVKGTRIMVQGILDNAEECTPEEIAGPDIYPDLSVEVVRRILDFALDHPPPFDFGEGEPTALLLTMVLHHYGTAGPTELDSFGVKVNADAMRMLHRDGYIKIIGYECGDRIAAKLTFPGRLLMASLRAEQERRSPH